MTRAARSQAERVIARFGGVPQLHAALKRAGGVMRTKVQLYRWTYPVDKGGTGGRIPLWMLEPIRTAARVVGLELTDADLAEGGE